MRGCCRTGRTKSQMPLQARELINRAYTRCDVVWYKQIRLKVCESTGIAFYIPGVSAECRWRVCALHDVRTRRCTDQFLSPRDLCLCLCICLPQHHPPWSMLSLTLLMAVSRVFSVRSPSIAVQVGSMSKTTEFVQ